MTAPDPLRCSSCGHTIEAHRPGDYNRDACVGAGYKQPWGVMCRCEGFAMRLLPAK